MKKYEFTGETKVINDCERIVILRRIRAVAEFGFVKAGDIGGWIEKEQNLSRENESWVSGDAMVYGNAKVYGNAIVYDYATVHENAKVCDDTIIEGTASISGNAMVYGNAIVYDRATVRENAKVCDDAIIGGTASISGNAMVCGNTRVGGNAVVCDDAMIFSASHILTIGAIGSGNDFITFYRNKERGITVKWGCFLGNIDEFLKKITDTYGESKYSIVFRAASEVAKLQIDLN